MADILTADNPSTQDPRTPSARRVEMLADWTAGMRQVEIAAKYGISQGQVSKIIGGSPRARALQSVPTEASSSEWRARCLLAAALLNHRATEAGLTPADVETLRLALAGEWDA